MKLFADKPLWERTETILLLYKQSRKHKVCLTRTATPDCFIAQNLQSLILSPKKTGEPPVLLLDDVLAELDDVRQNYLLKTIDNNTQTIITSVDTLLFDEKFLEGLNL